MAKDVETRSIMNAKYQYETLRVRDPDGKLHYIRGNHDAITKALTLHVIVNGEDINQVAHDNELELLEYTNPGQLRMAIGNKLRAKVKRGEPVVIGGLNIKSVDQAVKLPLDEGNGNGAPKTAKPEAPAPKAAKAKAKGKAAKAEPASKSGKKVRRRESAAA